MKALTVERPHGFLLWKGKQTAIGHKDILPTDEPMILASDGEAFGEVTLGQPVAMNLTEFDRTQKEHCVRPEERKLWWPDTTVFYMYRLKDWQPYEVMKSVDVIEGEAVFKEPPALTDEDMKLLAQVEKLPKQITLSSEAVYLDGDKAVICDGVEHSQVEKILQATLGAFGLGEKSLDVYHLALVRNPHPVIEKKKETPVTRDAAAVDGIIENKQEETMPDNNDNAITCNCGGKCADSFNEIETSQDDDKAKKPDVTKNKIRVRVIDPKKFNQNAFGENDPFRVMPIDEENGIQATIGKLPGDDATTIQDYIFDKDKWTADEAAAWVDKHEKEKACKPKKKNEEKGDDEIVEGDKAKWTVAYINNLPDNAFLYIAPGGEIDNEKKTKPRTLRYFPYKDANGAVDLPHLRNAIARIPQSDLPSDLQDKLQKRAQQLLKNENKGDGEKAGRRLGKSWREKLKSLYETVKEMMTWANYEDEEDTEEENPMMNGIDGLFDKMVTVKTAIKEVNGKPLFVTWSTNAFIDREKEIFSTKSLEQYVLDAEKNDQRGYLNLWHIPGTDFAEIKWQGVVGRFLIEASEFLPDAKGKAAQKFFTAYPDSHPQFAPEGYGCSPEYRYLPEEKVKGVYEWMYKTRTSVLPRAAAANIRTKASNIMALTKQQKEAAEQLFGPDLAKQIVEQAETESKELEAAGVAHKGETEKPVEQTPAQQPAPAITVEAVAEVLMKQIETNLTPLGNDLDELKKSIAGIVERVKKLEGDEAVKAKVETPRYQLFLKRASDAVETQVAEGDKLAEQKPKETPVPVADKSGAANFFTGR